MIDSKSQLREPRFSVIVPAHNEEHRIGATLESYAAVFADSEIIVVLNGCTDETKPIVEAMRERFPFVHLVDIPDPVGKGGAVRAGFLLARADAIGYVDADGSTPAVEMRRLFERLGNSAGVIASRWLRQSDVTVKQPLTRRLASRCFNTMVRALFGLRYADTQCGAKAFRRDAIADVMRDVETSNLAFDVDLLFALQSRGFAVVEEPTRWIDQSGSSVRLVSASLRMFASLLRLRLKHSFMRLAVPLFDRFFHTAPLRLHDRLRILIVNWRDPRHPQAGGAEAYLFEQARCWTRWGHHVEWLTAGFPGGAAHDEIEGIRIRRVGNAATVYAAVPWTYLREFRDRFDVVVDSENGIPFFTPLYCLKPKVCMVYHVHQNVFRKHLPAAIAYPLMWCESTFVPWLYRRSRFVTISDDTRNEMAGLGIDPAKVGIVRCGVDAALVPGKKDAVPTVLYLGRLKPYKRVNLIIEAFAQVRERVPSAVLRIAGAGDARPALEAQVRDLGLSDAVFFEGFVDEGFKRELLQRAWVSVTASEMEGWGISVIESNACGTPAVAYDVPGLGEAVVDGLSGLLVPEGESLAPALCAVLTDRELRERLEGGSIVRASEFSWDIAAEAMLSELMQVIVGGRIRSVDLDEHWSLVGSAPAGRLRGSYALSSRSMIASDERFRAIERERNRPEPGKAGASA